MKKLFPILTALVLATSAFAHEYEVGDLVIDHPLAFETAATAKAGGGYMAITNTGESDDVLIGVKADFPKVMLHQTEEKDGVARMSHVHKLTIPAGETVELAPGGYHVMFMGLSEPLTAGDSFPATLVFEQAGELEVIFKIEPRSSATGEVDHSNH